MTLLVVKTVQHLKHVFFLSFREKKINNSQLILERNERVKK